jgi:hypothetical protein
MKPGTNQAGNHAKAAKQKSGLKLIRALCVERHAHGRKAARQAGSTQHNGQSQPFHGLAPESVVRKSRQIWG